MLFSNTNSSPSIYLVCRSCTAQRASATATTAMAAAALTSTAHLPVVGSQYPVQHSKLDSLSQSPPTSMQQSARARSQWPSQQCSSALQPLMLDLRQQVVLVAPGTCKHAYFVSSPQHSETSTQKSPLSPHCIIITKGQVRFDSGNSNRWTKPREQHTNADYLRLEFPRNHLDMFHSPTHNAIRRRNSFHMSSPQQW